MKRIFLILTALVLVQCAPAAEPEPANLLLPEKMTSILIQVHLAEARLEDARLPTDSAEAVFRQMQREIYQKHRVKEGDFNASYQYYLRNLSLLDKIYATVIDSLSARETMTKAQPPKQ